MTWQKGHCSLTAFALALTQIQTEPFGIPASCCSALLDVHGST